MQTDISVKKERIKEKRSVSKIISDFFYDVSVKFHKLFKRNNNKVTSLKTAKRKKLIFYIKS